MNIRKLIKRAQEKHGFPDKTTIRSRGSKYDPFIPDEIFPVRTTKWTITVGSRERCWKWKI